MVSLTFNKDIFASYYLSIHYYKSYLIVFFLGNKKRDVMMYFAKALTEAITEHITSEESTLQEILILNTDPMRHELVKEEFSRFTKNACNSNGYFESVVFVDCSLDLKTIETRL